MKRISFALTTPQFLDGSKTVTRRNGWLDVRAGDQLLAVNRVMGFKRGEHAVVYGPIDVLDARREPLDAITQADVIAEGFPDWTPEEFIAFYAKHNQCGWGHIVTRIEFRRVDRW